MKQEKHVPNIFSGTVTKARKASCNFQNNGTHKTIHTLGVSEARRDTAQ